MPVCQRYEASLPVKMAHFNMPLHVQTPGGGEEDYLMDDHYHPHHHHHHHDNGMTSPHNHELGTWMDDQSDGGGKFRLKRRRRCGQCGPCQVKENCGKCQYCVRKDILKQACIYRKCVYLRKPVPRFRPETTPPGSNSSVGGVVGGGGVTASGGGGGGGNGGAVSGGSSNSSINNNTNNNNNKNNNHNKGSSPQKASSSTPTPTPTNPLLHSGGAHHPHQHHPHPHPHHHQPIPSPFNPSSSSAMAAAAAAAAAVKSAELSSCQLAQNPFGLPGLHNGSVVDPLRAAGAPLDQQRGPLFDPTSMLPTPSSSYLSPTTPLSVSSSSSAAAARGGIESGRSPALDLGRNTNTADSGFGTNSSMTTSPASSVSKDRAPPLPPAPTTVAVSAPSSHTTTTPRGGDQFRSPMEQWGGMPYGFTHPSPWSHPALQASPAATAAAAAYGFPTGAGHYTTNPFGSSCRLGMGMGVGVGVDPTSHLAAQSSSHLSSHHAQPAFHHHHNMPFVARGPDFPAGVAAAHPNYRASAMGGTVVGGGAPSSMQAAAPSFYPPPQPPHIPSSLPNFPSFSQLPSSAGPHGGYPMAHHHHHHHPPMYPGNFYSSFRPPTEPQIYHAQLPFLAPESPFSRLDGTFLPPPYLGEGLFLDKGREEEEGEDDLKRKFSIFRIPSCRSGGSFSLDDHSASENVSTAKGKRQRDVIEGAWPRKSGELGNMLLKTVPAATTLIDEDLQRHLKRVSGRRASCQVISIDDFKMHAFIRSDGFNHLEIEIDNPSMEAAFRDKNNNNNNRHRSQDVSNKAIPVDTGSSSLDRLKDVNDVYEEDGCDANCKGDSYTGTDRTSSCPKRPHAHFRAQTITSSTKGSSEISSDQCQRRSNWTKERGDTSTSGQQEQFWHRDQGWTDRHSGGIFGAGTTVTLAEEDQRQGTSSTSGDEHNRLGSRTLDDDDDVVVVTLANPRQGTSGVDEHHRTGSRTLDDDVVVTLANPRTQGISSPSGEKTERGRSRTLDDDVVVCVSQEGGMGEVEVSGAEVELEEVGLDHPLLSASSDPHDLLRFISQHAPAAAAAAASGLSSSPDLVFNFGRTHCDDLDLDPEYFS